MNEFTLERILEASSLRDDDDLRRASSRRQRRFRWPPVTALAPGRAASSPLLVLLRWRRKLTMSSLQEPTVSAPAYEKPYPGMSTTVSGWVLALVLVESAASSSSFVLFFGCDADDDDDDDDDGKEKEAKGGSAFFLGTFDALSSLIW